jgi:hypothetical protein
MDMAVEGHRPRLVTICFGTDPDSRRRSQLYAGLESGFCLRWHSLLAANPYVVGPFGLKEIWATSAADNCTLTFTRFWVEHAQWGLEPLRYHLVAVLFARSADGILSVSCADPVRESAIAAESGDLRCLKSLPVLAEPERGPPGESDEPLQFDGPDVWSHCFNSNFRHTSAAKSYGGTARMTLRRQPHFPARRSALLRGDQREFL